MMKSIPAVGDSAARCSPEERAIRIDLAAAYRLVAHFHWDDLVFTHITARVPGPEHHFLINPYGMMFDEITASSLVKIDMQANKVDDNPWPVNPAGLISNGDCDTLLPCRSTFTRLEAVISSNIIP